jgi:hypothetical protein
VLAAGLQTDTDRCNLKTSAGRLKKTAMRPQMMVRSMFVRITDFGDKIKYVRDVED